MDTAVQNSISKNDIILIVHNHVVTGFFIFRMTCYIWLSQN